MCVRMCMCVRERERNRWLNHAFVDLANARLVGLAFKVFLPTVVGIKVRFFFLFMILGIYANILSPHTNTADKYHHWPKGMESLPHTGSGVKMKEHWDNSWEIWIFSYPALILSCVTVGEFYNLSMSVFSCIYMNSSGPILLCLYNFIYAHVRT